MNSETKLALTSRFLSYLENIPSNKKTDLAEWIINELLDRVSSCTSDMSECDIIHDFRDDMEYLIYRNPNDPRNEWLRRSLAELHRIEIFQLQHKK